MWVDGFKVVDTVGDRATINDNKCSNTLEGEHPWGDFVSRKKYISQFCNVFIRLILYYPRNVENRLDAKYTNNYISYIIHWFLSHT